MLKFCLGIVVRTYSKISSKFGTKWNFLQRSVVKPIDQYTSMNFCLVTKMGHTNSTSDFDGVIQSLLDCVLSSTVYVAHAFLSKASKFKSSSVFGKMQDASG